MCARYPPHSALRAGALPEGIARVVGVAVNTVVVFGLLGIEDFDYVMSRKLSVVIYYTLVRHATDDLSNASLPAQTPTCHAPTYVRPPVTTPRILGENTNSTRDEPLCKPKQATTHSFAYHPHSIRTISSPAQTHRHRALLVHSS